MSEINKLKVRAQNAAKSNSKMLITSAEATELVKEIKALEAELKKVSTDFKQKSLAYENLKTTKAAATAQADAKPKGPQVVNVSGGSFE